MVRRRWEMMTWGAFPVASMRACRTAASVSRVLESVTVVPVVRSGISDGSRDPPWGAEITTGSSPGMYST